MKFLPAQIVEVRLEVAAVIVDRTLRGLDEVVERRLLR